MFGKSLLFALLASICVLLKADVILECKNNGNPLHPYPGDCTRFFECTPQGIEVHVCPDGLHFNRGYLVCDYPQSAGCTQEGAEVTIITDLETTALPELTTAEPEPEITPSEEVNTTPDGETEQFDCPIDADDSLRPHPTNCNQFYQCFWGETLIYTCQEGLHFNPAEQVCDYPENVGCVGGTVPPNVPTTQAPEIDPETTPESQSNTTPDGETEQFDCPIDADHSLRPHPTNCNQFYQCFWGETLIYTCEEGLHFNPAEQVCDYPENVGCVGGTVPPNVPTTQDPEIDPETTPESQSNTTPDGETEQFDCPIDADHSLRPHPTNCNQFYQCFWGETLIYTCEEGLHFNPAEQVCDYPENVGCVGGPVPPNVPITEAPEIDPETTPESQPNTTPDGETEQFDCPIDADHSLRPHPTNCNQFYQCFWGETLIYTCQEGLHFNPAEQVCDYPENVGCVGGTVPPNVPTTQAPEIDPETTPESQPNTTPDGETEQFDCPIDADLSFRPHPTNCNQFYQCYAGESHIFTCQDGLYFNPAEQVCDYPENVGCVGGTVPPNVPTTQDPEIDPETTPESQPNTTPDGETEQFDCPIDADLSFRPHPTNCNQFYQCYAGESHIFTCQDGLYFNPAEQVCDYPENVGCAGGTAPPVTSTSAPAAPTTGGGASDPEPFECRSDSDQLYHSVPTNCNQFYQCYDGHAYIFNCQVGLQFHYEAQACDYPQNVGCVNA